MIKALRSEILALGFTGQSIDMSVQQGLLQRWANPFFVTTTYLLPVGAPSAPEWRTIALTFIIVTALFDGGNVAGGTLI